MRHHENGHWVATGFDLSEGIAEGDPHGSHFTLCSAVTRAPFTVELTQFRHREKDVTQCLGNGIGQWCNRGG